MDEIKTLLEKHNYTEKELKGFLKRDVKEDLRKLIELGDIVLDKKQYVLAKKLTLKRAKIIAIKEYFSFAALGENQEDGFINNNNLNGAFIDDEVYLKEIPQPNKTSYEVFSIIKRGRQNIVGELRVRGGTFILEVDGLSAKDYVFVIGESSLPLIPHSIVLARIEKSFEDYCLVTPVEILGSKNEPGVEISRIIAQHDAPLKFPKEVSREVKSIPSKVEENEIKNRTDFRDHVIVTIDGEDAKDFDDAVEVSKEVDVYHVGVHIADVSYYVKEGSAIDKEAELRSTSIYASDRVVPMLPLELSNGICSLNPSVDRFVQSVVFDIHKNGKILSYNFHKGVIKSSARLTYTYVNKVLNTGEIDNHIDKKVNDMIPLLKEVADIIRKNRYKNGCLELSSTELYFVLDEDGSVRDVRKRKQDVAEKLIEDLMIQANELVAYAVSEKHLPFLYRIHENPKSQKMETFMKLSSVLGYPCSFSSLSVTPKQLEEHLLRVDDPLKKEILSVNLLRALAKARYSLDNHGHFGLALKYYSHFTSPIRRYPDLIVHRLLDLYFFNIGPKKSNAALEEEMVYHGENTSSREKRAQTIEREVEDLLASQFMKNKIGQEFEGHIISLMSSGMFVELDNGIDGFVPFENLNEYFTYYENLFMAISSRGTKFKLGDRVKVIVSSVDNDKCQITFSLPSLLKKHTIKAKEGKKHGRRKKTHRK